MGAVLSILYDTHFCANPMSDCRKLFSGMVAGTSLQNAKCARPSSDPGFRSSSILRQGEYRARVKPK